MAWLWRNLTSLGAQKCSAAELGEICQPDIPDRGLRQYGTLESLCQFPYVDREFNPVMQESNLGVHTKSWYRGQGLDFSGRSSINNEQSIQLEGGIVSDLGL